ncbi:MAG: hypothetical protein WCN98_16240, partial [Verrucomicrobiaceae bacterium]
RAAPKTPAVPAATELYDEINDPAETESLHDKPENQDVIAKLAKFLPALGASTPVGPKTKAKK